MLDPAFDRELPVIRPARRNEIPQVSALIVAALSPFLQIAPRHIVTRHIESSRDIERQWNDGEVLVLQNAGALVGAAVYYARAERLHMGFPADWAAMRTLVVSPAARGRGFGRVLVRHLIDRARANGVTTFGLHTAAYMQSAVRIYEAAGFVRCPEFDLLVSKVIGADASLGDFTLIAYRLDLVAA